MTLLKIKLDSLELPLGGGSVRVQWLLETTCWREQNWTRWQSDWTLGQSSPGMVPRSLEMVSSLYSPDSQAKFIQFAGCWGDVPLALFRYGLHTALLSRHGENGNRAVHGIQNIWSEFSQIWTKLAQPRFMVPTQVSTPGFTSSFNSVLLK